MYKKCIAILLTAIMAVSIITLQSVFADIESTMEEPLDILSGGITKFSTVNMHDTGGLVFYETAPSDILVSENANFSLYLNKEETAVRVLDKRNGYLWSSAPIEPNYFGMSTEWQRFSGAIAVVDFITDTSVIRRSLPGHNNADEPVYEMYGDGFAVTLHFFEANIRLKLIVKLTDDGMTVEAPDEYIEVLGVNKISRLYIMPFLGASHANDIPGYIFVPDGCGALIRFAPPREYRSSFVAQIYGTDLSVTGGNIEKRALNLPVPMQQVYLPVFGITHGYKTAAFAGIIMSGEEFCEIEANPAGNIIDYFWASPRFIYQDLYWQPTGGNNGFNAPSPSQNSVNAKIVYSFLSGEEADYVGMANKYKQTLVDRGLLKKNGSESADVPLKLDAIMGESADSLIGVSTKSMTTTSDISRWIQSLKNNDINNLVISLIGAQKGGVSSQKTNSFSIDRKAGGESGLRNLFSDSSVLFTLQNNYALAYTHQFSAGDAVYSMNGSFIVEEIPKPLFSVKRYLNNQGALNIANRVASQRDYKKSLSIDGLANTLLSDYRSNRTVYREQAKENIVDILGTFTQNTNNLLLESPNDYAFSFAQKVYNTPDTSSMLMYQSDIVPFYQIVLSGYVEMFTPYLNYRSNSEKDLLKIIDYNMYPSYLLTEEYSNEFAKTNIIDVYSSRYDDWEPLILSNYEKVNNILKNVKGQEIISRNVLAENIVVVGYSGGGSIVVNYTEQPYQYEGTTIDALSGVYIGGR